jgi:outer membrane biosynthesis protein TonB
MLQSILKSPVALVQAAERRLSINASMIAQMIMGDEEPSAAADPDAAVSQAPVPPQSTKQQGQEKQHREPLKPRAQPKQLPKPKQESRKQTSPKLRVKREPQRDLPFRAKRHKAGFYSENNLISLAWSGEGTSFDPIVLS